MSTAPYSLWAAPIGSKRKSSFELSIAIAQAQQLVETEWHPIGPDMLLTGYLPAAGGLWALHQRLCAGDEASQIVLPLLGAAPPPPPQQQFNGEQSVDARQRAQQDALRQRQRLDRVRFASDMAASAANMHLCPLSGIIHKL